MPGHALGQMPGERTLRALGRTLTQKSPETAYPFPFPTLRTTAISGSCVHGRLPSPARPLWPLVS